MTLTITIDTENAAFEDAGPGRELARILHQLAEGLHPLSDRALRKAHDGKLYDLNGNHVGRWTVAQVEPPPAPLLTSPRPSPDAAAMRARVLAAIHDANAAIDGTGPHYHDARPPTGDDYNDLIVAVCCALNPPHADDSDGTHDHHQLARKETRTRP